MARKYHFIYLFFFQFFLHRKTFSTHLTVEKADFSVKQFDRSGQNLLICTEANYVDGISSYYARSRIYRYRYIDIDSVVLSYDRSTASSKASSLHRVRPSVFSFNVQYPVISLKSSSSCLRLRSRLLVTSISFSILPQIMCFRRQFQRKVSPIQLAFLLFIVCTMFCSFLTLCSTSSFLTRSAQIIFFSLLQHYT